MAVEPMVMTPEQASAFVAGEVRKWKTVAADREDPRRLIRLRRHSSMRRDAASLCRRASYFMAAMVFNWSIDP